MKRTNTTIETFGSAAFGHYITPVANTNNDTGTNGSGDSGGENDPDEPKVDDPKEDPPRRKPDVIPAGLERP